MSPILRVALDTPLRRLFDYLPPQSRCGALEAGVRLRVPFGRRSVVGVLIESVAHSEVPAGKLRAAQDVLDGQPVLDAPLLALLRWAADYYHHPLGEVLAAALPRLAREGAPQRPLMERWSLTVEGETALVDGEPKRAPKQRALLRRLAEHGGADAAELDSALGDWRPAARSLVARGWIASSDVPLDDARASTAPDDRSPTAIPELSDAQRAAVDAVRAGGDRFHAFVLHGVTGSGKTEVYLRLAADVLARGRSALVLVPEIGLTPQLVARFTARFGAGGIALLHSGLTDVQRLAEWRRVLTGAAPLVLGTRSAVFAPARDLGLIVVDEEHDASLKQQDGGFRYSARDLAVMRAQQLDIPVLLGSATPSLETLQNVSSGRYTSLPLPRRADQAPAPRLRLVDLRQESLQSGLAATSIQEIERHLAADGQVLVYINRRGYAPTLLCSACGWVAPCRDCDARMTVYRAAGQLRCHHCGAERPLPRECPQCGYRLRTAGQGTERVEEALAATFPSAPIVRLDRDAVRRQHELEAVLERVTSGAARILVGTQMVTKGHDFPNVTLVVVLNADQGLFSTDFRAAERLAQTIVQVAGRAGRANRPGEVLIQTAYPGHPLLASLLADGYGGFARTALAERREAQWPPFSRLAALRCSATRPERALGFLEAARRAGERLRHGARAASGLRLLGPAPAAMARRAGRHHAQLLVESPDRAALHRFLRAWVEIVESLEQARRVRWALDVDPLELF